MPVPVCRLFVRCAPVVAVLLVSGTLLCAAEDAGLYRLRLHAGERSPALVVADLTSRGLDVTYADAKTGTVEVMGHPGDLDLLVRLGFAPEIVDVPLGAEGIDALSDYLSPAEIEGLLAQYEANYPALAKRVPYATDHEGRIAYALKISDNVALEEDEPAVLFVAQHHAREVMTPEVAIDTIDQLLVNYATDATIRRWVDESEVWVVPTHNPDGTTYMFATDNNWRKNRRDNGDGSFGVDLNRNYPFGWNQCGGSSGSPGSDTYRGPSPGSEPTTVGLMNLAREHRPVYYISYHTYGEYALHPYGCDNVFPGMPDYRTARELANAASVVMKGDVPDTWYRFGTPFELLYSVDGDTDGWMYGELGSFGVTYELNTNSQGFQPDYATWRNGTVLRAREGWRFFLRQLDAPRVTGHVRNACSAAAIGGATIHLAEQAFTNGEQPRTSTPVFGRIDWPVLPGTYTLQVSEDGYAAQTWPVTVGFAPEAREVALVPEGTGGAALWQVRVDDSAGDNDGQADPGETIDLYLSAYATGGPLASLTATLVDNDPYLTVVDGEASFSALAAGEHREADDPVRATIAADAPDGVAAALDVTFAAAAPFCSPPSTLPLRITRGVPSCPAIEEKLDVDPGWQIDNGGSSLGWAFGQPTNVGPPAAYTGVNVYGTNLSGNYGDLQRYTLTAGPYDLADLRNAELRFARWLQSEPGFDIARVEVRTGSSPDWRIVWEGFGRDTSWLPARYDVSALVDTESEVYVRFSLTTDNGQTGPGFYVDDLAFCGEQLPGGGPRVKYAAHTVDDTDPEYANANAQADPGETFTIRVDVRNAGGTQATGITGVLSTTAPGVRIHNTVAEWPDLAPGATAGSLAPHFTVTPDASCGATIAFTLTTRWQDGGQATSTFTVPLGELRETMRLNDDFETDKGWLAAGDAIAGTFVRQNPYGVTAPGAGAVQPENDATPDPGQICWVTANPVVGPGFNPASGDVDRGTVYIQSPVFDGVGEGALILRYARWFHRSGLGPLDQATYRAQVSTDGGANWTDVETLDTNASAWVRRETDLAVLVEPASTMRLRFSAFELVRTPGDPLVELLVDDVQVVRQSIVCDPFVAPDAKRPNPVGGSLRAERAGPDVRLTWTPPPVDGDHDPARFFPVYRSVSPASGFAQRGDPSAPAWRDAGNGGHGSGSFYYLVAARNAAGDSGEAPTP